MTIKEAIKRLEEIKKKLSEDTEVFFDCPKCLISFTPDKVVNVAVHFQDKK